MGILRFFYSLLNNHPQVAGKLKANDKVHSRCKIDVLALDLNAVIHPVYQSLLNPPTHKSLIVRSSHPPAVVPRIDFSFRKVFEGVCEKIDELMDSVRPSKTLYLAIDGVAGAAKQSQQRQRRFHSALIKTEAEFKRFDSNCISPGTVFMNEFSGYLREYIRSKILSDTKYRHIDIIISNEKVPGEGEHKIIRWLSSRKRDLPQKDELQPDRKADNHVTSDVKCCIYSPDADLIMLSLGLNQSGIFILRDNAYDGMDCKYFFVDIDYLRTVVVKLMGAKLNFNPPTSILVIRDVPIKDFLVGDAPFGYQLIQDYIVMCFTLGNDFLPTVPSVNISTGAITTLTEMYSRVVANHGHLVILNREEKKYRFSLQTLKVFFQEMANHETRMLYDKYVQTNRGYFENRDPILDVCVEKPSLPERRGRERKSGTPTGVPREPLDFKRYCELYYQAKLPGVEKDVVCYEYIRGLLFVLNYYLKGIPDWNWCYPFHYAPFFTDLYAYMSSSENIKRLEGITFEGGRPMSMYEQLLSILPSRSRELLSPSLRGLMNPDSAITDFYPSGELKMDYDGKKNNYEAIILLPLVDLKRLRESYSSIKLTESELKGNEVGQVKLYRANKKKRVAS